jgi:hypothetical protein
MKVLRWESGDILNDFTKFTLLYRRLDFHKKLVVAIWHWCWCVCLVVQGPLAITDMPLNFYSLTWGKKLQYLENLAILGYDFFSQWLREPSSIHFCLYHLCTPVHRFSLIHGSRDSVIFLQFFLHSFLKSENDKSGNFHSHHWKADPKNLSIEYTHAKQILNRTRDICLQSRSFRSQRKLTFSPKFSLWKQVPEK